MKERQRARLSTTVDPELLDAVDRFVAAHEEANRSQVIDEALRLWAARERERAIEAQFAAPRSAQEQEQEEHAAWKHLRRAAATRLFRAS